MSALRTRREARERVKRVCSAELDRVIPLGESIPLKGATFLNSEDQVQLVRAVVPTLLGERAGLEPRVAVQAVGCCPQCGWRRVYLRGAGQP